MSQVKVMNLDLVDVKDTAGLIVAVIGAVIAVVAFWQRLASSMSRAYRAALCWILLPSRIMRDVAIIKAQTLPNGGKSLADSIQRLELGVMEIRNKQLENYQITAALAANDDVGIWQSDPFGFCIAINQNILRRVGFAESEALGKGWVNYINHADRERIYREWFESCAQSRDFISTYSLIDADGKLLPVKAHSYPIRNIRGEITKYVGLVRFL